MALIHRQQELINRNVWINSDVWCQWAFSFVIQMDHKMLEMEQTDLLQDDAQESRFVQRPHLLSNYLSVSVTRTLWIFLILSMQGGYKTRDFLQL